MRSHWTCTCVCCTKCCAENQTSKYIVLCTWCTEHLQNNYRMIKRGWEGRHGRHKEWEKRTEKGRERERQKPTGRSLTPSDVVAAAAVIFPSGGNKVTLACVRTGDRRSGRLQRWRRPLLTRAGVSRGDRSEELLTGGPWHHTAPAPRGAASAHLSTGSLNGEADRVRSYPLPSSPTVTLFCYSTNPHVKDRQRHEILIRPGASHIAFCCKGVSAGELSIDSLRRYTSIEDLDLYRSAFDLL